MSKIEPQYWNGTGRFSKAAERLWACIPAAGSAPTIATEIVRCVSSIIYDKFNNGNGNRDNRGPHSTRAKAKFLKKFKEEVCQMVAPCVPYFKFTAKDFLAACDPILRLRGSSGNYIEESNIFGDGFLGYAAILAGEPAPHPNGIGDEEAAFLLKIDEQPKCRTTRLVYADWLDDQDLDERATAVRVHAHLIF